VPPRSLPCPFLLDELPPIEAFKLRIFLNGTWSLRSTDSAAGSCLPWSVFPGVVAFRCCAHRGSSRYSWPLDRRWQSDSGPRETPRSPRRLPDPPRDASAAGATVAFVRPVLLLLCPALGFAFAIERTKQAAHFVSDWCKVAEPRPAMRSAPPHSTSHGRVAGA
jgi:hypothetical protein